MRAGVWTANLRQQSFPGRNCVLGRGVLYGLHCPSPRSSQSAPFGSRSTDEAHLRSLSQLRHFAESFSYVPISSKEKFKMASEDALDPGGIVVAAAAGGVAQLLNSNRAFGQEVSGYGRYFAAAYGNHVIGDFMTEGVYPSLLHQDPRYFRRGTGSAGSRLGYAISADCQPPQSPDNHAQKRRSAMVNSAVSWWSAGAHRSDAAAPRSPLGGRRES